VTQLELPEPTFDEVTALRAQAHANATPTERAARERVAPVAGKLRGDALLAIVRFGEHGLTVSEALGVLGLPERRRYSLAPRFTELKQDGYVVDHHAPARSGGATFTATEKGRAWAQERAS
jgi:hypothetical protein